MKISLIFVLILFIFYYQEILVIAVIGFLLVYFFNDYFSAKTSIHGKTISTLKTFHYVNKYNSNTANF